MSFLENLSNLGLINALTLQMQEFAVSYLNELVSGKCFDLVPLETPEP